MTTGAVPRTSFLRSANIQRRVIFALLMREIITRFGRRNLGVLWLIAEPMVFTCFVATLWSAIGGHKAPGMTVIGFAVTGYSSVLMWRNSVSHNVHAVRENINLLYHRNVNLYDVMIARVLIEILGASASFFILSTLFILADQMPVPSDMLMMFEAWVMLAWFGTALAILVGAGSAFTDLVARLWYPLSYVMFPLSGAAFLVAWIPENMRQYILLLPMVHGVEMLRQGYFGSVIHTYYDMTYMGSVNLVITFLGLTLMRKAERHLEAD